MATSSSETLGPRRLLIGVTGSVATIKLPQLISHITTKYHASSALNSGSRVLGVGSKTASVSSLHGAEDIEIRIMATHNAMHFLSPPLIPPTSFGKIYTDADEWRDWRALSNPICHITLRNWASVLVIAPLDANTLGKVASGICDNLLTCVLRAWPPQKPVLVCPAMNTAMWEHPITRIQLNVLEETFGYHIMMPVEKRLACGDYGVGGMEDTQKIADKIHELLERE